MSTNPASAPEPTEPAKAVTPKSVTKKAATPAKAKPATNKAAKVIVTKTGWEVAITRNQAHVAYRKQRTLLHGVPDPRHTARPLPRRWTSAMRRSWPRSTPRPRPSRKASDMDVIGYTRVSTREQAQSGHSLVTQRRAIEAECERRGWTLVEVIEDAGFTGTNDDRPGLQRALMMLKRKQARALVMARMDRLARSTQHLCEFITRSKKQKWSMVALDMGLDTTTANGRMVVRILAAVAEWESEMNSERVKDGMAEARANGARFGFQRSTPADTVARILHERSQGQSFNAIAAGLDADRIPTPGGGLRWYGSTVTRLHRAECKLAEAVA